MPTIGQLTEYIEQRAPEASDQIEMPVLLRAATVLGRYGAKLRRELEERASDLDLDALKAVRILGQALEDQSIGAEQRAAMAWALGQIGGFDAGRELLRRAKAVFVDHAPEASDDVRAELVQALGQAMDGRTIRRFQQPEGDLVLVASQLLDDLLQHRFPDPNLQSAVTSALAQFAVRGLELPRRNMLAELLNAPEPKPPMPVATLGLVSALDDLIPRHERAAITQALKQGEDDIVLNAAFRRIEKLSGRTYDRPQRALAISLLLERWQAETIIDALSEESARRQEEELDNP